ncbi:MAG: hypothetical protein CVU56_11240 [Deltaproteobacteria bacterium HGW-Deltaproteobacteria-14]|jgi:SAM-dependent methyltransferase|nr:MAG: hypothetical protein CVU56_11240 [Deltaproteobacteria bacterium HGW-Deltaproteobacteria-14]
MTVTAPRCLPTVSDPTILRRYPDARVEERDALLELVDLTPGMRVLDLQAAGGYLSEAVWRRLDGAVSCVCVEPSDAHRARLDARFVAISDPIERFPSVPDASIDVVLGLAGLHHSTSHAQTVAEAHRVLRPGGALALCDVLAGSAQARWLNDFVDRHCPSGHDGRFPEPGATSALMRAAGFDLVEETVRDVPWRSASRADILGFMVGIFGLATPVDVVDAAVDDYLELRAAPDGSVAVTWPLMYCRGVKPRQA